MLRFNAIAGTSVALLLVGACNPAAGEPFTSDGGEGLEPGPPFQPDPGTDGGAAGDGGFTHDHDGGDRPRPNGPPDPSCDTNGCLRAADHVGDYSRETLLPFLENGVEIDNGYSVWTIRYKTQARESVATVTIPFETDVPERGFDIVANNHGTTGLDDPCALTGSVAGTGLAGLFGARGMIGVAPDYPGQGTDGISPYLVADVEGPNALDALRATAALARWQAMDISERFAMVGLSQGGHATLAAASRHQAYAPELEIRAFAASGPAAVRESHFRSGVSVNGAHLALHAMVFYAWSIHYDYDGPTFFAEGLDSSLPSIFSERCYWEFSDRIDSRANRIFSPGFLRAYRTGNWTRGPDFGVVPSWFEANQITPFSQTAAIRIYQGLDDATVLPWMTDELVADLREGGMEIELEHVENGHHTNVAFGFVASRELRTEESIDWIRARLSD